ncbi:MAG: RNA-guided endonuclease InsQ/TnpB family protein [Actinomycetes bacterium]
MSAISVSPSVSPGGTAASPAGPPAEGVLWRAAGARRFAHNWAVAKIKANANQWAAEASYGISKTDRVRPLSYFTLAKQWTAAKPTVAPWAGEHSTLCYDRPARVPAEQHQPTTGASVGVDRGVRTSAVVATADRRVVAELAGVRALRDARRKVAHLQRDLSRTRKGSANRVKAIARLGRAHARVAAVRADALHMFTARLARRHAVVVLEDLATANLMKKRHLAAAIGDQGWAELARQLQYKTARHGGQMIVADRWLASSKTCSCCGWVTPKLSLAGRTYICGNTAAGCHLVADRDVNAAANLAAWGEAQLAGRTQVGDRHPGGPSAGTCRHACGGGNESAATPAGASGETGPSRPRTRVA